MGKGGEEERGRDGERRMKREDRWMDVGGRRTDEEEESKVQGETLRGEGKRGQGH